MVLVFASAVVTPAIAQYPGEPKIPDRTYDPVYDANYHRQWGSPNEVVRQAQQVLRDQGYYRGPIDGLVKNPEYLRAIWSFQKAKGLPATTHLDAPTLAALDVAPTALASPPSTGPSNFAASPDPVTRR
jgi:peptidoglycan hydrolase-like protein with peptidoglycan-binding domain